MPSDRIITYKAAVLEALAEEMARDPSVVVIGEDVGAAGGVFRQTEGLFARFGAERVIDTPISEPGIVGMAVGAAMTGLRPLVEVMFGDFVTLGMDSLVNQAAKVRYLSDGAYTVPLVLRTAVGVGGSLGAQHSQSFHAWFAQVPGLQVVMPSTPHDAKGLMAAAIRSDDPVIFFEDRQLYNVQGPVPEGALVEPIGRARVVREGTDLTLIAISRGVRIAAAAADLFADRSLSAELIDLRSLVPLDMETVAASVRKTSRAVVIDLSPRAFGITGEIAARIGEDCFDWLDAPVLRIGAPQVPVPFAPALEAQVLPRPDAIVAAALAQFGLD